MRYGSYASCLAITLVTAFATRTEADVLSHWRFDELNGLVAADTGGLVPNNATWRDPASANLSWGQGLIGNAAVLSGADGTDNVFDVGSIEAAGATQLSYSMWLKPNLVQVGEGGAHFANKGVFASGAIGVQRSAGPTPDQFWATTWEATPQDPLTAEYRFRVDSTGTSRSATIYDATTTEPEWIHVVFTWDGTAGLPAAGDEEVKLYVNGALESTAARNASEILSDGGWQIGRDRAFRGRAYGGLIDDLVVWDQTLTAEQITAIYNGGLVGDDAVTALSLTVGIPGDVNDSGAVDDEDFEIIRTNFWQQIAERNQGDLIDNNFIDFSDYGAWRKAMQNAAQGSLNSLQVPEPSSLLLLLSAVGLFVRRRRN